MLILIVGVLGTLVLVEGGLSSTSRTTAREQGTNLARDLVERSRQAAYTDMAVNTAPQTLHDLLPGSDSATAVTGSAPSSTFQMTRRNVVYTVKVFSCAVDDPSDGIGIGTAGFCVPPSTPGPNPDPIPPTVGANVLGISVAAGGSLLNTVCNALGNPAVIGQLTATVSTLVPVSVCPPGSSVTDANLDSNADDFHRVRIDVSWSSGGPNRTLTQTTLLPNPS